MGNDICLYVVAHKEFSNLPSERTVIGVGEKDISVATVRDNTGDNISSKNKNYCELTALYWIWKNSNYDIVGLEHYRRFFLYRKKPVSSIKVKSILSKFDVILPKKPFIRQSIYKNYVKFHYESDLLEVKEIIKEKYPDYLEAFNKLNKTYSMYMCNMFVAKKNLINDYCKWLFDILFELEKRIDISGRDDYQKRVYGFLSERLLNLYFLKNEDLKIKELSLSNENGGKLRRFINRVFKRK